MLERSIIDGRRKGAVGGDAADTKIRNGHNLNRADFRQSIVETFEQAGAGEVKAIQLAQASLEGDGAALKARRLNGERIGSIRALDGI